MEYTLDFKEENGIYILGQYEVKVIEEKGIVLKHNFFFSEEEIENHFLRNQRAFNSVGKLVNEPLKIVDDTIYYKYFDGFDLLPSINRKVHRAKKCINGTIKDGKEVAINILIGYARLINEAKFLITDICNGNNIMVSKNTNDICFIDLDTVIDINLFTEKEENSKILLITMNYLWSIIISLFTSTQITNDDRTYYQYLRGSAGINFILFNDEKKTVFNEFFKKFIEIHQDRNLDIKDMNTFVDELKENVLNVWEWND